MPLDTTPPAALPAGGGALRRVGTLAERGWRLKLYTPAGQAGGLRPGDLATAARAFRATIAAPSASPIAGFAVLCPARDADGLTLSGFWWEDEVLHRSALLLPGRGAPPRRLPAAAGRIGCVEEVLLMAREAAAWHRCGLGAAPSSSDAYLAECCA